MKHRLLSLALVLCLSLSLTAPAAAGYSDIPSGHWCEESVLRATELGLFEGVGGDRFGRGQPITRASFVTALVRLFGWEAVTPSRASYSDVTPERWFYTAVETARANGAFPSTSGAFRPTENITREEMASMLMRSLGYASLAGAADAYPSPFTDVTVNQGFITLATADGRLAGTTYSDGSVSAAAGTDKNGVYALFESATVYDHSQNQNAQMNLKLHPSAVQGVQGTRKLLELVRTYMRKGGFHVQFNVVSSDTLRDAQKEPEKYRDLMVRVAGFTQYWCEIGKPIQDEVINRTEYEEA